MSGGIALSVPLLLVAVALLMAWRSGRLSLFVQAIAGSQVVNHS